MFDRRQNNVAVFQDTEKLCKTNQRLMEGIHESNQKQELIHEEDTVEVSNHVYKEPAKILVSRKRTLEAAKAYPGKKVCVHNFASATSPGGGVTKGSNAQEECICRCSTLYENLITKNLMEDFYEKHCHDLQQDTMSVLYNDDCIYTPNVIVIKTDTSSPERLMEEEWYQVDVITCAAPNFIDGGSNFMNPNAGSKKVTISNTELEELHIKRMSRLCDIAIQHHEEVLILGAFGCGAFRNPPEVVAKAMKRIVEKYRYAFRTIEFAVYCSKYDTTNYDVFHQYLAQE